MIRWGIYCSDRTAGLFARSVAKPLGIDHPGQSGSCPAEWVHTGILLAKPAVKAETALEAGDLSFQIGQPVCATFFPNQFDLHRPGPPFGGPFLRRRGMKAHTWETLWQDASQERPGD